MRRLVCAAAAVVLPVMVAPALGQIVEAEPNNNKLLATPAPLAGPGATITGSSTGSQGSGSAALTADYFLVSTSAKPRGIYRYRLVNTGGTTHTHSLRGLTQSNGTILATEAVIATASSSTSPGRFVQWYGFGRTEQVYVRVNGTTATTSPYTLSLEELPVNATPLGTFLPGAFVFNFEQQGHMTDTEVWLYNAELEPIVGAGNDDTNVESGGSGSGTQSWLARALTVPGTYYLAVSDFNLCNNLASPVDDDYRNGPVFDLPGATACSSENTGVVLNFQIRSPAGPPWLNVPAVKTQPYQVLWYSLIIQQGPCPADFNNIGGVTVQDLYDFLAAWSRLDVPADFNGNGRIDVQDVYDFISAWFVGCP